MNKSLMNSSLDLATRCFVANAVLPGHMGTRREPRRFEAIALTAVSKSDNPISDDASPSGDAAEDGAGRRPVTLVQLSNV
jgi:hypothetical protein